MASYHEQGSDHDSSPNEKEIPSNSGYVLDNRRRAALAEVDNAKFSCAPDSLRMRILFHSRISGGSMQKSVSLLVSGFSQMRKFPRAMVSISDS